MKETQLYAVIRKYLPGVVDRVENGAGDGMPDVNGCCQGEDYWVELKIGETDEPLKLLRPSQSAWMYRRLLAGASNIFILVRGKQKLCLYKVERKDDQLHASLVSWLSWPVREKQRLTFGITGRLA